MLVVNDNLTLSERFLRIRYVRSRGPGGQNVNKVNTCAQLVFEVEACGQLSPQVKHRLKNLAGRRWNQAGQMILESDRFREQKKNRQEVLHRLRRLIRQALVRPKVRRATKPSLASKRRIKASKQHRSQMKSLRRAVELE